MRCHYFPFFSRSLVEYFLHLCRSSLVGLSCCASCTRSFKPIMPRSGFCLFLVVLFSLVVAIQLVRAAPTYTTTEDVVPSKRLTLPLKRFQREANGEDIHSLVVSIPYLTSQSSSEYPDEAFVLRFIRDMLTMRTVGSLE